MCQKELYESDQKSDRCVVGLWIQRVVGARLITVCWAVQWCVSFPSIYLKWPSCRKSSTWKYAWAGSRAHFLPIPVWNRWMNFSIWYETITIKLSFNFVSMWMSYNPALQETGLELPKSCSSFSQLHLMTRLTYYHVLDRCLGI